jgi:hypothetical protein
MRVPLNYGRPVRPVTADMFTDITSAPFVGTEWNGDEGDVLVFDGDLTTEEQDQARFRALSSDTEQTIRSRADQALADLRTIRDSTGTLTTAQLSSAVRVLARVGIGLIRLALRRFSNPD